MSLNLCLAFENPLQARPCRAGEGKWFWDLLISIELEFKSGICLPSREAIKIMEGCVSKRKGGAGLRQCAHRFKISPSWLCGKHLRSAYVMDGELRSEVLTGPNFASKRRQQVSKMTCALASTLSVFWYASLLANCSACPFSCPAVWMPLAKGKHHRCSQGVTR